MTARKNKSLAITHPELATQWHPYKNGNLTPHNISAGSGKKVWWKCSVAKDHEWRAAIYSRSGGRGCPCCAGQKVVASNCLATIDPKLAAQWHPHKNGNLTPYDVTIRSRKKVWWKCYVREDHEWEAVIKNRTIISDRNKGGCPCCFGNKVVLSNCLKTTHPKLASEWHPNKNGQLTPEKVIAGSSKKVWWKCSEDHEWEATINGRGQGRDCPCCNESKGEKVIANILSNLSFPFNIQQKFKSCKNKRPLPFDFVVETSAGIKIIEYQGKQHYEPMSFGGSEKPEVLFALIKKHDAIKRNWCISKNIPFLAFPYWDFDNLGKIVADFLYEAPPYRTNISSCP